MTNPITNDAAQIDSRDIIARIEELEAEKAAYQQDIEDAQDEVAALDHATEAYAKWQESEGEELALLQALADQAQHCSDWQHGATLIREDAFVYYIEELIHDCYEMPKELDSGNWPWRHVTIDYEAAAEEAKDDYDEVDFGGVTYLIRT